MSRCGKILTAFFGLVFLVAVVVFAAAWYYASEIEEQALTVEHEPDPYDLRVASIDGGLITLEATAEPESKGRWAEPGIWGLASTETYNQVGSIVEADDRSVVRELIALGPLPRERRCGPHRPGCFPERSVARAWDRL
jgi:hypothetical protein